MGRTSVRLGGAIRGQDWTLSDGAISREERLRMKYGPHGTRGANLREAVLRNSFTTLGIAVGVASGRWLLSAWPGNNLWIAQSRALDWSHYFVRPRQIRHSASGRGGGRRTSQEGSNVAAATRGDAAARNRALRMYWK